MQTKDYVTITISVFSLIVAICALLKDWWRNRIRYFLKLGKTYTEFYDDNQNIKSKMDVFTVRNRGNQNIYIESLGFMEIHGDGMSLYNQHSDEIAKQSNLELPLEIKPGNSALIKFNVFLAFPENRFYFVIRDTEQRDYYFGMRKGYKER